MHTNYGKSNRDSVTIESNLPNVKKLQVDRHEFMKAQIKKEKKMIEDSRNARAQFFSADDSFREGTKTRGKQN